MTEIEILHEAVRGEIEKSKATRTEVAAVIGLMDEHCI